MKLLLVIILASVAAFAQTPTPDENLPPATKPEVTFEQLQAKIVYLEAQLSELRLTFQYAQQVCGLPDMMRAKLATGEAAAKLPASKPAATAK